MENNKYAFLLQKEFDQQYTEVVSEQEFEDTDDFFDQCTTRTNVKINPYSLNTQFEEHHNGELLIQIYINDSYCMVYSTGGYILYQKR